MTEKATISRLPSATRRLAAAKLRQARRELGLSQEAAARMLGVGVRTLRAWECCDARMTALEALIELEARAGKKAA